MPSSTSSPASRSDARVAAGALAVDALSGPARASVIHDVDLHVAHGARLVVLGPMESGKSMLMRHILGLERAARGRVAIDGMEYDPTRVDEDRLREVRSRVGAVFERPALLRDISIVQNVELPLLERRGADDGAARDIARNLLVEVGVRADENSLPPQLDRAEQRRVAFARALALGPALMLLDEPTHGLDAESAHAFDAVIAAVQQRHGFALVRFTHEVRYAYRDGADVAIMANGAIVARGPLDALLASEVPVVKRLLQRRGAA